MQKMRIGVLMGGKSAEHEVSFNSGRTVADHIDTTLYDVVPLFQKKDGTLFVLPWHFLHRGKTTDFEYRLEGEAEVVSWDRLKKLIDFMFIALHGRYAEDGTIQGMLEILGIPYLGSKVLASALSMDKIVQKKMLSLAGIKTPRFLSLSPEEIKNSDKLEEIIVEKLQISAIQPPYIIKPQSEGSSLGVSCVCNQQELKKAIIHASSIHSGIIQAVLIEEKIEGMEFSCILLTDITTQKLFALPPTEIVLEKDRLLFDYEQKYMPGRAHKRTPPLCTLEIRKKIENTALAAAHALGLTGIARIDGFVTADNDIVIIDPNALAGMDPASFVFRQAAEINMSHTQVINHLIATELVRYGIIQKYTVSIKEGVDMSGIEDIKMGNKKIRIAVLMGGDSNEKEISLASGRNIVYKLSPQKYQPIPLFVTDAMELYHINQSLLVRNTTQEIQANLDLQSRVNWSDLSAIADFVFIALHGGKGEDGSIQGALEMLGMPYNGSSVLASGLCMDKYKTGAFLKAEGFDVPFQVLILKDDWKSECEKYESVKYNREFSENGEPAGKTEFFGNAEFSENSEFFGNKVIDKLENNIRYPMIVKPADDGCSVMVSKVASRKELCAAIEHMFDNNKDRALVEEYIQGMELTVGVLGNQTPTAFPPSQTVTQKDILSIEEKFLPGAGENLTPASLPSTTLMLVRNTIEDAYSAVGCIGYARIDCFYQRADESPTGRERVVILEINTLPGMTPATCIFHQAAEVGIRPMDFIDSIIELGFEYHVNRQAGKQSEKKKDADLYAMLESGDNIQIADVSS